MASPRKETDDEYIDSEYEEEAPIDYTWITNKGMPNHFKNKLTPEEQTAMLTIMSNYYQTVRQTPTKELNKQLYNYIKHINRNVLEIDPVEGATEDFINGFEQYDRLEKYEKKATKYLNSRVGVSYKVKTAAKIMDVYLSKHVQI